MVQGRSRCKQRCTCMVTVLCEFIPMMVGNQILYVVSIVTLNGFGNIFCTKLWITKIYSVTYLIRVHAGILQAIFPEDIYSALTLKQ